MKVFMKITLLFLAISPVLAATEDFSIEDNDLIALPHAVETAIRNSKGFDDPTCKLIGKPIDISGKGTDSGYAATTADACDWGAALGPIWVVRNGTQPAMVLSGGGYSLSINKQSQNGLHNITIYGGSASYSQVVIWAFDGKQYIKKNSYFFSADDPATCKAHPDICPFEIEGDKR
jgi:hypothetical protein